MTLEDRRSEPRLDAALDLRFSINDGSQIQANSHDLSFRSISIKSTVTPALGDDVQVYVNDVEPQRGRVARLFNGGFAVVLPKAAIDLIAVALIEATINEAITKKTDDHPNTIEQRHDSDIERVDASSASWARLSSLSISGDVLPQHVITLIGEGDPSQLQIGAAELICGDNAWPARIIVTKSLGRLFSTAIQLNAMQIEGASENGLVIQIPSIADEAPLRIRADKQVFFHYLKSGAPIR